MLNHDEDLAPITKAVKQAVWTRAGRIKFAIFVALLIYLVGPTLMLSSFYPSVILWPGMSSEAARNNADKVVGTTHEEYYFENQRHDKLHANLWRLPGAKYVIIYHHGNAGDLYTRVQAYAALRSCGVNVFAYDYAGYGRSTGKPSLPGLLDDAVAATDFATKTLNYAPQSIVHYGESIGTGPACYAASLKPAGGLILQSAISSLPKVAKADAFILYMYPDFCFGEPHMDACSMVKQVHCPIAVMVGGKDPGVPVWIAKQIYDSAHEPKSFAVLVDSGHSAVESGRDLDVYLRNIKFVLESAAKFNG